MGDGVFVAGGGLGGVFVAGGGLGGVLVVTAAALEDEGSSLPPFIKKRTPSNTTTATPAITQGSTDFSLTTTVVTVGLDVATG